MTTLYLRNNLTVVGAPKEVVKAIKDGLTLFNQKYLDALKMGRTTRFLDKYLTFYEQRQDDVIVIPRGCINSVVDLLKKYGKDYTLIDQRFLPEKKLNAVFQGDNRGYQDDAFGVMLKKDWGVLCAPTGSGKTVIALRIIAARNTETIIIVHTKELVEQWKARIHQFLGLDQDAIGVIAAGKWKASECGITVALINTLYRVVGQCDEDAFGMVVVDECHRCPSRTFTEAVSAFWSKYLLGLSATPTRRDNLQDLIFWQLGTHFYKVPNEVLMEKGRVLQAKVIFRETDFAPKNDIRGAYGKVISEMTADDARNRMIVDDVERMVRKNGGGIQLVLSDRKAHCRTLADMIEERGIPVTVLTGELNKTDREEAVRQLVSGRAKVAIATGQLIGEGFDCEGLTNLFLTIPIRYSGRLIQYIGRVLRPAEGKRPIIFDYKDVRSPPLVRSAKKRLSVYNSLGHRLME